VFPIDCLLTTFKFIAFIVKNILDIDGFVFDNSKDKSHAYVDVKVKTMHAFSLLKPSSHFFSRDDIDIGDSQI
jgi:hypothetical protein